MLLGLAMIAVPLLVAVVDAAIQIRHLTAATEELVGNGVRSARLTQSMFADIASMERTVKLYQVMGEARLLDRYRDTDQGLATTRTELSRLLDDAGARHSLDDFAVLHNEISAAVTATPPGSPAFTPILARIDRLNEMAQGIALSANRDVDLRLENMRQQTAGTQRRLFWQSALLVPLTLIAILFLTLQIGRPLRAIDRPLKQLVHDIFSPSIEERGSL